MARFITHNYYTSKTGDTKETVVQVIENGPFPNSKNIFSIINRESLNPFPHIVAFWRLCKDDFLKTCWQKKKLLKTSNFSFIHHVFNSIQLLYFHLKGVFFVFVFKVVGCRFVVCGKGLMGCLTPFSTVFHLCGVSCVNYLYYSATCWNSQV